MKKLKYFLSAILFISLFTACDNTPNDTVDLDAEVDIISFSIDGKEATIDATKQTIKLLMPPGSDLTTLEPSIAISDGAIIKPASGVAIDFTNSTTSPIEYRVFNKNLYNTYKVTVEETRAKITLFKVGNVIGNIDEATRTITLYFTIGTDITALVPTIQYTEGAVISPTIGTAVDFTNPVVYTLDYAGASFQYTVSVVLGEAPGLVIYNGEDVSPVWEGIAVSKIDNGYANPKTDGINTSLKCVSITRESGDTDAGGKPWSGGVLWNSHKVNIDPTVYNRFTLLVLKEVAGDVQIEIQSDGEQNKDWLKVWYSGDNLGEWQKLTFYIPEGRTAMINNILIAPHVHDAGSFATQRMYWDELIALPK